MIEKIMKAVKSGNKKRGRNITIGAVVGMLVSCTAVMGADEYLWIKNDGGVIKFSTDNSTPANTENPYGENTWDGVDYVNNVTLNSTSSSYGLKLEGDLGNVNFTNNSSITATITGYGDSYGIRNERGTIGTLTNNGTITGTSTNSYSYGICNNAGTIGTLTNNGIITGTTSGSGYGIRNERGTIGTLTNNGIITGTSENSSGYGIYNNAGTIGTLTNNGTIARTSTSSSGNGIYSYSGTIEILLNNGIITGTSTSSYSYGIYNNAGTIGTLTNNGIITGTSTNSSGYGIYNEHGTIGTLTNNGIIAGTANNSSGYGIYNKSATIETLLNNGTTTGTTTSTYGSGYGIYNESGTIRALTNNGTTTGIASGREGYGIYNKSSTIGTLLNNGTITGTSTNSYGYGIFNQDSSITELLNNGFITGTGGSSLYQSGYGIYHDAMNRNIEKLTNNGIITGTSTSGSGYGITTANNTAGIKILINNGTIAGTSENGDGYGIYDNNDTTLTNTGVIYGKTNAIVSVGTANNYGLLISQTGETASGTSSSNNSGLIFKDESTKYTATNSDFSKFGTTTEIGGYTVINTKAEGTDKDNITGTKSIELENGVLTYDDSTGSPQTEDVSLDKKYILNGITDTLLVSIGDNKFNNSVINAYGTAVKFSDAGGKLTLSGTTVNGGIKTDTAAILGSDDSSKTDTLVLENSVVNGNIDMQDGKNTITAGNNTTINGDVKGGAGEDTFTSGNNVAINGKIELGAGNNKITLGNNVYINGDVDMGTNGVNLTGGSEVYLNGKVTFTDNKDILTLGEKSVIVQDIAMKDGNDELTIGAGSIVNGKLDGEGGTDTLTFGTNSVAGGASMVLSTDNNISISHDISNFEKINVNAKTTFSSNSKVTGATSGIEIGANGVLVLTIDKTTIDAGGIITGHALYGNTGGTITSTGGGKLLLALNGAGNNDVISFGGTELDGSIKGVEDETIGNPNDFTINTTSKLHTVKKISNTEVEIIVNRTLPDYLEYSQLNKIYQSIVSVDDLIGNFNVDDEGLVLFLDYLNNIYAGSPYSYSSELSRKSVGMFRDIVTDNQFKANTGKWMIYGGLTHVDGGTKDTYYGKGYYTYDIGSSDMDADTKITGAYMLGEYGVSDTLTSGVVIGGNKLKSDLSNGSKVDGSALYIGAYAKKYIGNLKVTAGAGFQYGDYAADRMAVNRVASDTEMSGMKYSDNYNDMTYDIYLNGRYSNSIGDNLFLEPYAILSYTYIDQDGANEGSKALAIETDSKSFDYTVGKVGVDLKKVIPHEKGKSTLSAGISYTKILDGAEEEYITGRFKGGSDFDILVAHKNEHSIGLNAKYALELENGILFDVKGTYSVERDSHNQSGKNKTKGEWIVGAGLGYKF